MLIDNDEEEHITFEFERDLEERARFVLLAVVLTKQINWPTNQKWRLAMLPAHIRAQIESGRGVTQPVS